jgi:hypothetical protein
MTEPYDVGVLIHFPDAVSEQLELELIELARKWDALADTGWPFGVAILPVGEYLMFVFEDPDNANLFISHAEKHLQSLKDANHNGQAYTIVMCWTGLLGGELS